MTVLRNIIIVWLALDVVGIIVLVLELMRAPLIMDDGDEYE